VRQHDERGPDSAETVRNIQLQAPQIDAAAHQAISRPSVFVGELLVVRFASALWPAPGSEDTELGVLMEPEVGHGEAEVYT
jgi:hypothetical protein